LEATEHDDRGAVPGEGNARIHRPHQTDQFLVDDLDDLFARVDAAEDRLADYLLLDAVDEVGGDGEVDVGVEEGAADFFEALLHVGLGEPAAAAQLFQGLAEAALNAFKHGTLRFRRPLPRRPGRPWGQTTAHPGPGTAVSHPL